MKPRELCALLGADGFIGSHLAHALVDRGFAVRAVDRFPNAKSLNLEEIRDRIEVVSTDLFDQHGFDISLLKGVKYLFHFATPSTPASSLADPVREFRDHLIATVRIFQAAREMKVSRVLFPSSGGTVYGSKPKSPVSEDSLLNPTTPHSIVKVAAEEYLNLLRLQGVDSIVYRIANAYGPRQRGWITRQGVISVLLRAALLEEPVPIASGIRIVKDYIFIEDVVSGVIRSFDKPHRHNAYNIGSGKGTSLEKLIGIVEEISSKKVRTTTRETRIGETTRIVLDVRRASREFNWLPTVPLAEGISKTWQWIQDIADQEFS